jgi:hypothetical protein
VAVVYHPDIDVVSGADWTIAGTLYDASGALLDVTNATLAFTLLDMNGEPVDGINANASVSKTNATQGAIQIEIPSQYTTLVPGRYTDALQVTEGASRDIFWIGQILVAANPFNIANNITELPAPPAQPTADDDIFFVFPPWWAWRGF